MAIYRSKTNRAGRNTFVPGTALFKCTGDRPREGPTPDDEDAARLSRERQQKQNMHTRKKPISLSLSK